MTRYANRWTALCAWIVLMGIMWAVFVPSRLSVSTFVLLGPLLLVVGSMVWGVHRPLPSAGQICLGMDAADAAARVGK